MKKHERTRLGLAVLGLDVGAIGSMSLSALVLAEETLLNIRINYELQLMGGRFLTSHHRQCLFAVRNIFNNLKIEQQKIKNKIMRLLFLLILFFAIMSVYSQKPKQVLEWINTAHADNRDFYFEIPFEYRSNEIIIQVAIGKETYDYIFDTGRYNDIIDGIQKKNNFPVLTTQTVGSSNGIKSKINLVKVDSLKIGELVFKDIAALQMNFENSPTIKCTVDGALIGASIIKEIVWQIDFSRKKIIVSDQLSKMPFIDHSIKLPVTFNTKLMPFVEATLDGKKEKFMFDLGSSTQFSLTGKAALKYISTKQLIEINGLRLEGGNGVLVQTAKVFIADSIEIAAIKFKNKPVLFSQTGVENIIGNPIIKNLLLH